MNSLWMSHHSMGLEAPLGQLAWGVTSLAWLLGCTSAVMPQCSFTCVKKPDTFHRNAVGFIRTCFDTLNKPWVSKAAAW